MRRESWIQAGIEDFNPSGFFAFRTPLLPFKAFTELGDEGVPGLAEVHPREQRIESIRRRLMEWTSRPGVSEAIYLASPSLWNSIPAWLTAPRTERGRKTERSLMRYFARLSGRATPFGLFAGTSVGLIGSRTVLTCAEHSTLKRHSRLDNDFLFALCQRLSDSTAISSDTVLARNSSLYLSSGRWRFVQTRVTDRSRSHHLVALDPSPPLEIALEAAERSVPAGEIAERLAAMNSEDPISIEEATEFLQQLVHSQVLTTQLWPLVTGEPALEDLLLQLERVEGMQAIHSGLRAAKASLASLDRAGVGAPPSAYEAIVENLRQLPVELNSARLFQVDMATPAHFAEIDSHVVDELKTAVSILARIAPQRDSLREFREAFRSRYEGRAMPLAEVLDPESGIGFESISLLTGDGEALAGGLMNLQDSAPSAPLEARDLFLLGMAIDAITSGTTEVELKKSDIEALSTSPQPLPSSFAVFGALCASSEEAAGRGDFQVMVEWAGGPTGVRLLGRFCHIDEALAAKVRSHLAQEEALYPEAIFAEIAHLPNGRVGNVLARPLLRRFEIPYLGRSGAAVNDQIPIEDLRVFVRDSQVVLWSVRQDRRVIPRLTTAHNVRAGLPLYRFLCAVQNQGAAPEFKWSWGAAAEALPSSPRVRFGRVILAPQAWRVRAGELARLKKVPPESLDREVEAWRSKRGLPRFVLLRSNDHDLPVDFHNPLSVDTLLGGDLRESATLVEMLPHPEALLAHGTEGRFTHELVVPFVRSAAQQTSPHHPTILRPAGAGDMEPRPIRYAPGTEWLFVKVYCGHSSVDRVLRETLGPLLRAFLEDGAVQQWYFVRFGDPDWHLRVRLQGDSSTLHSLVLPSIYKSLGPDLRSGMVRRLQVDTYDREVQRYGGVSGVELFEEFSWHDSEWALGLIARLEVGHAPFERWLLAIHGANALLDDYGLDLKERTRLMAGLAASFRLEHRFGIEGRRALGERFRRERATVEGVLSLGGPEANPQGIHLAAFARRSNKLGPLAPRLRACLEAEGQGLTISETLANYIHMSCNRLLRSDARFQELLIYDHLSRHYEGLSAIASRRPC